MSEALTHDTRDTLWVTDAELIRRSGVPEKIMRQRLRELDRLPTGFPQKHPMWGDRRYWPDVKAFFEREAARVSAPKRRDPR